LAEERARRQPSFRPGRTIELADGQRWTFPAPPKGSEWNSAPFGPACAGILRAIVEAEDNAEARRAELALAIYLLGHNYRLSPADFERVLGPSEHSPDSIDWQLTFHQTVQDYVRNYLDCFMVAGDEKRVADSQGTFVRLFSWLRNRWLLPWFSFEARRK
jgi:hypothetical protein